MDSVYYKNLPHTSTKKERKRFVEYAIGYLENNKWYTKEGEVKYNFPSVFRDSGKMREKKAIEKLSRSNSQLSKLFVLLGEDRFFYTIVLSDVKKRWANYDTVFDPKEMKAVKSFIAKTIKGSYHATVELCGYNGPHVHIISRKQSNSYLKSEKWIYDEEGLTEYLSKSMFSIKEKYKNKNIEYLIGDEYLVMLGCWVYWRMIMKGRRLPRTSWPRLENHKKWHAEKRRKRLSQSKENSDGSNRVSDVVIETLFPKLETTQAS